MEFLSQLRFASLGSLGLHWECTTTYINGQPAASNCTWVPDQDPEPGWWDIAFEGAPPGMSAQQFFCMLMGGCPPPPQFGSSDGSSGRTQPATKPAPTKTTPSYKNSCVTSALAKGAGSTALDAIGILPEGGTVSAAFSLFHGAAGVSNGIKIQQRVAFAGGIISTVSAAHDLQGPQESTYLPPLQGSKRLRAGLELRRVWSRTSLSLGKSLQ